MGSLPSAVFFLLPLLTLKFNFFVVMHAKILFHFLVAGVLAMPMASPDPAAVAGNHASGRLQACGSKGKQNWLPISHVAEGKKKSMLPDGRY